jgi:glycosyltransferase involved in cell wall biosynthesis
MDTGGGPLTIKRIVDDFPGYEYYVSGNAGVFMDYFQSVLPMQRILKLRGSNLLLNLILLILFCRTNSIDILHVHGRGAGSFARFVKLFHPGLKIIYTPNGFYPRSLGPLLRQIYIAGERILFSLTDLVFFVSGSEQRTFSESLGLNFNHKRFTCIQNYIDINLPQTKSPLPYTHPLGYSPKFLFIGRLSKQKGVDILVESLKKMKSPYQLTIIGYGEMEQYLRQEIEENLSNNVVFIGKLNEAFRYMPNFDALLLPSRFEGLPFTVLEAMLYRLCLVVTPCNGTIDIVDSSNAYIADNIDADSFAEAMKQFCNDFDKDKKRISALIDRNYEKVINSFSFESVKRKIEALYS